jgi:hypothetical protein
MHDALSRVEGKFHDAQTKLEEMRKVLRPPAQTGATAAALTSTGMVGGHDWQSKFWPLVGDFLVDARSVPWIIEACFGHDPKLNRWWSTLPPTERKRRTTFSTQFEKWRLPIDNHPLTTARGASVHRLGV